MQMPMYTYEIFGYNRYGTQWGTQWGRFSADKNRPLRIRRIHERNKDYQK